MYVYSPDSPIRIPAQDSTFFEHDHEIRAPIKWVPCEESFHEYGRSKTAFTGRKLYGRYGMRKVLTRSSVEMSTKIQQSLISTILPGTCARFYIQLHYCNKLEKIWNSPSTLREDFRSAALTMITWEHLTSNTGVGLTESYGSFWQLNSITGVEDHKVFFLTGRNEQCDN